jgi:ABC-2 type transport system ATP-binding protein
MLKIQNLSKQYAKTNFFALKDVSFSVKQGEFVALLGPNGAGKSTLINVLVGNVIKSSGQVEIAGLNLDTHEIAIKKHLGVVPQEVNFDSFFTVNQALNLQSGYFGIKDNQEYIDDLLNSLGLMDKKHTNTRALSGGMKRRLLIAKTLVHKPKLVVLDEPTAGVDIELRQNLYEFLKRLHSEGTTIILTTHYLEEAEQLCDRVIIINHGKMIADENKEELLQKLGKRVIVELTLNNEETEIHCEELDRYEPRQEKNRLYLKGQKKNLAEIFRRVSQCGIDYQDAKLHNEDLEDIFLKLVHQEEGEETC